MSGSRHFTSVDDWVILNQEVNSTEFRVYAILRSSVINEFGGIPKYGFRVTAGWVAAMSGELFSRTTAHRALRGLADKGVLTRLNDPKGGGEGAEFEFVVYPGENYKGPTNTLAEVGRLARKATRSVSFTAFKVEANPTNGITREDHAKPSPGKILDQPDDVNLGLDVALPAVEPEVPTADEDSEFDIAALEEFDRRQGETRHGGGPVPTSQMIEFASELEALTCNNPEIRLRLMMGTCRRVAEAVRPALEKGWAPAMLAKRLVAELNPKIHSPENLLLSKARDLGDPPPVADRHGSTVLVAGKALDVGSYDLGFGYGRAKAEKPVAGPAPTEEERRERLARIARRTRES
jgi:hypothetical protein